MLLSPPLGCNRPDDAEHLEPSLPRGTGEVADARISSSRSDAPASNRTRKLLLDFEKILSKRPKIPAGDGELDLESLRELYKRLVSCRFIAHKVAVLPSLPYYLLFHIASATCISFCSFAFNHMPP